MLRAKHTLIGAFLTTLAYSPLALADTYSVPGDFPTIQIALNVSANGDEIVVDPGVYFEQINFNGKAVTLRSSAGAAATTINALGQFTAAVRMISGEGPATVIDGFTITGADATSAFPNDRGGAIYVDNSSPTIRNCVFDDNQATYGGGIYSNGSAPNISNCEFRGNGALRGGGLYSGGSNGLVMTQCLFDGNSATDDGGGLWVSTSSFNVNRCVFRNNSAPGWGGGLYFATAGSPTVENCEIYDNQAGVGAAVATTGSMTLTLRHCTMTRNPTGNAVVLYTASLGTTHLQNCILWDPAQIPLGGAGTNLPTYSNISGGWAGVGNINLNPRFEDVGNRDLRLREHSPCIDAGNSNLSLAPYPVDFAGLPRAFDVPHRTDTGLAVLGLTVDMGAHEARYNKAVVLPN